MKRILMTVAYDGTAYCGWQMQPNGQTVEEVLDSHLSRLLKEDVHVIGASRTDSGVHARGNVCVFDTETRIPPDKIAFALNQSLPEDIRIQESRRVRADFHPRHCSTVKTYKYRIWNSRHGMPTERLTSYFVFTPLDTDKMREAAKRFLGTHDFASFCTPQPQVTDTVRTLYDFTVERDGDLLTFTVTGSGFLYHMVRILVGTLLQVGRGMIAPEDVSRILEARDRHAAPAMIPARGLTLWEIRFAEDPAEGLTSEPDEHGPDGPKASRPEENGPDPEAAEEDQSLKKA